MKTISKILTLIKFLIVLSFIGIIVQLMQTDGKQVHRIEELNGMFIVMIVMMVIFGVPFALYLFRKGDK